MACRSGAVADVKKIAVQRDQEIPDIPGNWLAVLPGFF
jgi:hypothetical protein